MAVQTKASGQRIFRASNGVEIPITPVPLLLASDIANSIGKPKQPTITVEGLDGPHEMIDISEAAQKAYTSELAEFEAKANSLYLETVLEFGSNIEFGEAEQEVVNKYRARLSKKGITIQSPNDIYVYIAYILLPNHEDVQHLQEAITNLNQATKDQLEKARDSFRS